MPTTATAYTYDELSEDAKKKAVGNSRSVTTEYFDWYEDDIEYWKEELAKLGYDVTNIYFSGFWCQGDGACFEGSLDVLKWLRATDGEEPDLAKTRSLRYWLKTLGTEAAYVSFKHHGRYYHEHTMQFDIEWSEWIQPPKAIKQFEDLELAIIEDAKDRAKKIYSSLQDTYEDMSSDEYVSDFLQANEYLFWQDGSPAHFN